jgi:hypothetical protein
MPPKPAKKTLLYKAFALLAIVAIVGPEIGVGYELIALIDVFGVELLVLASVTHLGYYWHIIEAKLRYFDPYFFISSPKNIEQCPALLAHAVPGFMLAMVFATSLTISTS